jgi:hypothetical protein
VVDASHRNRLYYRPRPSPSVRSLATTLPAEPPVRIQRTGASCPMCLRTASPMTASTFAAGTRATVPADCRCPWIRAQDT